MARLTRDCAETDSPLQPHPSSLPSFEILREQGAARRTLGCSHDPRIQYESWQPAVLDFPPRLQKRRRASGSGRRCEERAWPRSPAHRFLTRIPRCEAFFQQCAQQPGHAAIPAESLDPGLPGDLFLQGRRLHWASAWWKTRETVQRDPRVSRQTRTPWSANP
jgi:hypothetical protein